MDGNRNPFQGVSSCDHCREPCFTEEGVQVLTPQPVGMFCLPECAAAHIEADQHISQEEKQRRHQALEQRYGRRVFSAPTKQFLRTYSLWRDDWLVVCWSKLTMAERMRAERDRMRLADDTWAVKFRK